LGEGRYRQIFGNKESCQVFLEHLQRVNQICKNLGLTPLIWSDSKFHKHTYYIYILYIYLIIKFLYIIIINNINIY